MNRAVIIALLVAVALVAAAWLTTPPHLQHVPSLAGTIDLQRLTDESSSELVPGTQKRIVWAAAENEKTTWSVVALHGFSATRQETAPLAQHIAAQLGANLYETRLSGHGLTANAMVGVTAEQWLDDTAEALAVAAALGDKIVLIGTSTGATLAMAMLEHPLMSPVDSLVFLSPNFYPHDASAAWLTRPAGPLLARLLAGKTRTWVAHNELQARYWTTSYPTAAVIEMMRLVDRANGPLPVKIPQRVLMFYSAEDQVISTEALLQAFEQIDSPQKELVVVRDPGDPSHHILAGDILSSGKTAEIAASTTAFVLRESVPGTTSNTTGEHAGAR